MQTKELRLERVQAPSRKEKENREARKQVNERARETERQTDRERH